MQKYGNFCLRISGFKPKKRFYLPNQSNPYFCKKNSKMKRLFAAIKVHPDPNLLKIYSQLRASVSYEKINWVSEKNIHITLKFFGDTHEHQIDTICEVFDEIAGRHKPFTIRLKDIGIFGSRYNPRVIWFGMENCPEVERLAADVINNLEDAGFQHDGQHFRPHLTVGRVKMINDKSMFQKNIDKLKNVFLQEVPVTEFHLYESILRPQGPLYNEIECFKL